MNALAPALLVGFFLTNISRATSLDDFQRNQAEPLARLQAQLLAQPETWNPSSEDRKLLDALDNSCHQRDCLLSRLPWHTNLDEAKAEAKAKKRPILSLQLLGRLDETLSCANSRFFRALLYPNGRVASYLRDNFVLHWKTVRPVPKLTIDFGDGRSIETTITGNSVHYVLDAEGRPLDALPGLYAPKEFLEGLTRAAKLAAAIAANPGNAPQLRSEYHRERLATLRKEWTELHKTNRLGAPPFALPLQLEPAKLAQPPLALNSGAIAITKSVNQIGILTAMDGATEPTPKSRLGFARSYVTWRKIAALRAAAVELDTQTMALIKSQHPELGAPTLSNFETILASLRRNVAEDTLWNEYALHPIIHSWLIDYDGDLTALNDRVYDELFLTPAEDPWMGLRRPDSFSGIPNNGIRQAAK